MSTSVKERPWKVSVFKLDSQYDWYVIILKTWRAGHHFMQFYLRYVNENTQQIMPSTIIFPPPNKPIIYEPSNCPLVDFCAVLLQ